MLEMNESSGTVKLRHFAYNQLKYGVPSYGVVGILEVKLDKNMVVWHRGNKASHGVHHHRFQPSRQSNPPV